MAKKIEQQWIGDLIDSSDATKQEAVAIKRNKPSKSRLNHMSAKEIREETNRQRRAELALGETALGKKTETSQRTHRVKTLPEPTEDEINDRVEPRYLDGVEGDIFAYTPGNEKRTHAYTPDAFEDTLVGLDGIKRVSSHNPDLGDFPPDLRESDTIHGIGSPGLVQQSKK